MPGRLTDQAAVAVALARRAAEPLAATVGHLLIGLAVEPDGRAGRRLRERATAAASLCERAALVPTPPLAEALTLAARQAGHRPAGTVDLLDAAIAAGGDDVGDLLGGAGYQRDLDGWVAGAVEDHWYDEPETYGFQPEGDGALDPAASRVVSAVRAVAGGAVDVLIAGAAAPDGAAGGPDPRTLAAVAARMRPTSAGWDAGLDAVVQAAATLGEGPAVTVGDLMRAALVAGGEGPPLVLHLAEADA